MLLFSRVLSLMVFVILLIIELMIKILMTASITTVGRIIMVISFTNTRAIAARKLPAGMTGFGLTQHGML